MTLTLQIIKVSESQKSNFNLVMFSTLLNTKN